ncbi:MAG: trehalose-phosphatase [Proteobacteria bacterium]|nr:trehalose-phosphatase [Pseudomonadota bacterium]
MIYLFSEGCAGVLAALASGRLLVAFDFDGTLAPIVSQPDDAQMRPRTRELFAAVSQRFPCAVISGRSQADVAARLGGASVKYVVGNHGLEPGLGLEDFAAEVARARALLEAALAGLPGVEIEDKRYSLAIHYRRSDNKRQARRAIQRGIERLPVPMRLVPGRLVANLVPQRAPHKGDALLALRRAEGADAALYVGDDVTDEDVFKLDQPRARLLTLRVGASRASAASYYLRDQHEIDRLLGEVAALRETPSVA